MYKLICIFLVSLNIGTAWNAVGTQPDSGAEPYSIALVWIALLVSALPAWLGYMVGKKEGRTGAPQGNEKPMLHASLMRLRELITALAWVKYHADIGQIKIARSTLKTGYEIALLAPQQPSFVKVYNGGIFCCLEQAMRDRPASAAMTGPAGVQVHELVIGLEQN